MRGLIFILFSLATSEGICTAQTPQWAWGRNLADPGHGRAFGTATDVGGNVYVAGRFTGSLSLDGQQLLVSKGVTDAYLAKFDASGDLQWVNQVGNMGMDQGSAVAIDDSGDVYFTGAFSNTTVVGADTLTSAGDMDVFLIKYTEAGQPIWAKSCGGEYMDCINSWEGSAGGIMCYGRSVYLAGHFADDSGGGLITYGTAMFGSTQLTSNGKTDMFVSKFDQHGNVKWARSAGGVFGDGPTDMKVDKSGNLYVAGGFGGSWMKFGSYQLDVINYTGTAFIAKYDSTGQFLWANRVGGTQASFGAFATSIAVDTSGNAYLYGSNPGEGPFIFPGGPTLSARGGADIFLAKYGPSGSLVWARHLGGYSDDDPAAIIFDPATNKLFFSGAAGPGCIFGTDTLPAGGAFIARYTLNGQPDWVFGGTSGCFPSRLALGAGGSLYACGFMGGQATFGPSVLTGGGHFDMFLAKLTGATTGLPAAPAQEGEEQLTVYPNPASQTLHLRLPAGRGVSSFTVQDLTGRRVKAFLPKHSGGTYSFSVDDLAPGLYLLQATIDGTVYTRKFLVER